MSQTHNTNYKPTELPQVIKGSSDWRDYKSLKLPNGITCVLVHDKESKTTACSVSVGVGASADPRELSGLAHFAEHMCFLGSEEYPKENEFKSYLSAHGGRSNASTSMSQTCFKFDVLAPNAEKAIDIFANFFVCPLFTESGTGREVNAVDSENSKNVSNDGRRRLQILKALADPQHHYSKFSTGNKETLFTNDEQQAAFVREVLLAFHRRHYRPDNMSVVVVGPQPLNTLEDFIVGRFAKMKSRHVVKDEKEMTVAEKLVEDCAKDLPEDSFGCPSVPYHPSFKPELQGGWPVLLTTKPLQSVRQLYLYFPLPPTRDLGDASPYSILGHLLGHEGPGSCFAVLQDAELVDAISVGPRLAEADQSLMQISVSLTEKGEKYWKEVVTTLFQYCRMLEKIGKHAQSGNSGGDSKDMETMKRIWDEIGTIRRLNFHNASPSDAFSFAPNLATSVRKNGTEKCLSLGSLLDETRDSLPLDSFVDFIQRMVPDNCIIERCSKSAWEEVQKVHCDKTDNPSHDGEGVFGLQKEKWYGVDYHLSPIPLEDVEIWKRRDGSNAPISELVQIENLQLPVENRFIPRDLSLCSDLPEEAKKGPRISKEMDPPNLIADNKFGKWCFPSYN
jgi:insulysin